LESKNAGRTGNGGREMIQIKDISGKVLKEVDAETLSGANLLGANLSGANLTGANLTGANLPHFQIVPEVGAFVGWKKLANGTIAKLEIPADAKRTSSLVGRKCRASKVVVLEGEGESPTATTKLHYAPGMTVEADSYYDDDIRVECSHGIHFFLTKAEAEEWELP
jgi:hypothetical protein